MNINVLGFGLMARQIAALFYVCGYEVTIWNHSDIVISDLERNIKLLKKSAISINDGSIRIAKELNDLSDGLTIESVVEDINIKRELYGAARRFINRGYVTNSSSLSPVEIGLEVGGIHFFNPILLKIVEVYSPPTHEVIGLDQVIETLSKIDFNIINAFGNRGYLGNLMLFTEISNFFKLHEVHNYCIESIKKMYNILYEGRDLLTIVDLVGVDVSYNILQNLNEVDKSIYVPKIFEKAISEGILGKKNKTTIKQLFESRI